MNSTDTDNSSDSSSDSASESVNTRKKWMLGVSTFLVAVFCLLALASPDGKGLEKRIRTEIKQGTQLKDVADYCKQNNLTYEWNAKARRLTIVLPGGNWLPLAKVTYREDLYFDNFNRYKGLNGNLVYGLR
jgi:hypothetical protein